MSVLVLYLAALVVFLVVDAVMLTLVMRPLFERHVSALMLAEPRLAVAGLFYAIYVGGLVWFAGLPALAGGSLWAAARDAALIGLLAYGTYESVNMSTLRGWSWQMVATDTLWGMVLSAGSLVAGVLIARALGYGA